MNVPDLPFANGLAMWNTGSERTIVFYENTLSNNLFYPLNYYRLVLLNRTWGFIRKVTALYDFACQFSHETAWNSELRG